MLPLLCEKTFLQPKSGEIMNKYSLPIITSIALKMFVTADVIETFDYSAGAVGNTTASGIGVSGSWQSSPDSSAASTATFENNTWLSTGITNYSVSPNSISIEMSATGETAAVQLTDAIDFDSNGVVYYSFLATRVSGTGGGGIISLFDDNGAGSQVDKVRLFQATGSLSWNAYTDGSTNQVGTQTGMADATDHLFVGRITTVAGTGNDTLEVFRTADGGSIHASSFDSNASIATVSGELTGSANFLYLWNGTDRDLNFGEVRLSDSYAAVIPEPASFVLVGLSIGAFLLFKKRKV
jgi:hypothetical protein